MCDGRFILFNVCAASPSQPQAIARIAKKHAGFHTAK